MNIIEHTDEQILEIAHPMWNDLIKYSNLGQYGKFIRKFSYDLLLGLNEVELGKQLANSILSEIESGSITNHDSSTKSLLGRYLK